MKTERFILSFITILIGLLVAGSAFYFYQMTNSKREKKAPIILSASPTPAKQAQLFQIDNPTDEEVVNKKVIQVKGKAVSGATITVLSDNDFSVTKASEKSMFVTDFTLKNGVNVLFITTTFPNGEEATTQRTVTYSTEDF